MSEKLSIGHLQQRIGPIVNHQRSLNSAKEIKQSSGQSFEQLLQANLLKFSHHAEVRLQERGIQMKPEQMRKLEDAVQKAEAKGAKESLILMKEAAFIVNVKNRTVVTALDGSSLSQHVFTQIDSAVIVNS